MQSLCIEIPLFLKNILIINALCLFFFLSYSLMILGIENSYASLILAVGGNLEIKLDKNVIQVPCMLLWPLVYLFVFLDF